MKIPKFENFKENIVVGGFGTDGSTTYSMNGPVPSTGYSMSPLAANIDSLGISVANEAKTYEENDNPEHTSEGYLKEAKKHICEKIDEACGYHENVNEEEKYVFDAQATADRLKKREEMNINRYRDAQNRGDNYAIRLYELRIKMDSVDKKKLEIMNAIAELQKKFKK